MEDSSTQHTPENAEPSLARILELGDEEPDDERPKKVARTAVVKPVPAANRPQILRSVVKGAFTCLYLTIESL